jgi:hypothetical protein
MTTSFWTRVESLLKLWIWLIAASLKLQKKVVRTIVSRGPRCEATESGGQNSKVGVWVGRAAMLGFVTAIGTEIASGKGVLAVSLSFAANGLSLDANCVVQ